MKTLGEILQLTVQCFQEKGIERPRRTAEELLSHVLQLPRLELYLQFDKPLLEQELESLRGLVKRALKAEPLAYLLGWVPFYGCRIAVAKEVLIPRWETEALLDQACSRLKGRNLSGIKAWDVCAGSGCIGIGLKRARPELEVSCSDLSEAALALARRNAEHNGAAVECLQGDLLAPFAGRKADIIFCNPPYVSKKEYDGLDFSVRGYEPKEALVGGDDGLLFYRRLSVELPAYLNPGACIFFEIGSAQGSAVRELFSSPCWRNSCMEKDLAGRDRFFFLEFESI
jgi:release factor glutamine methyltransferase